MPSTLWMASAPMNGNTAPSHSFIWPCLNLVFDLDIDRLAGCDVTAEEASAGNVQTYR